jgi:glutamate-5-semialdehyde dehydrogenase
VSTIDEILAAARDARRAAPPPGDPAYRRFARLLGPTLVARGPALRAANQADLAAAGERGLPPAILDRLRLDLPQRDHLLGLAAAVDRALPAVTADRPVGRTGAAGALRRVPKPLGVILMVYEARPTVTVEAGLLGAAVGNAVLLRGGSEMARTDAVAAGVIRAALVAAGLPADLVTVLADPDRSAFRALLARSDAIDLLVPRGSPSLIDFCRRASTIPVLASGGGVNHLYVHRGADLDLAARITLDSKTPEPTACNALEMVLVDRPVAAQFHRALLAAANAAGIPLEVHSDAAARPYTDGVVGVTPLGPHDAGREFLAATVAVRAVDGLDAAAAHIAEHGSGHTEGIVTGDAAVADAFVRRVDAAAVVVNGSLRLHDGPTLGLGPELSISTGRMHARGPVTLGDLLTHSLRVDAGGKLRTLPTAPAHPVSHQEPSHAR